MNQVNNGNSCATTTASKTSALLNYYAAVLVTLRILPVRPVPAHNWKMKNTKKSNLLFPTTRVCGVPIFSRKVKGQARHPPNAKLQTRPMPLLGLIYCQRLKRLYKHFCHTVNSYYAVIYTRNDDIITSMFS